VERERRLWRNHRCRAVSLNTSIRVTVQSPLSGRVSEYVDKGYRLKSQGPDNALLVKPKKFSLIWAILVGVLLYAAYYLWVKKQEQVYLSVNQKGDVSVTTSQV